jgi:hypothetical protein
VKAELAETPPKAPAAERIADELGLDPDDDP